MLDRMLALAAGFFVYVATLLAFVVVPSHTSKPALAGAFAAIAVACAAILLARRHFVRWTRTLGGILTGASLLSMVAVAAITWGRKLDVVRHALPPGHLDGFSDYQTGSVVSVSLLIVGIVLALVPATRPSAPAAPPE
jgi:hypothetical protein